MDHVAGSGVTEAAEGPLRAEVRWSVLAELADSTSAATKGFSQYRAQLLPALCTLLRNLPAQG
jgi:hypothetical protein